MLLHPGNFTAFTAPQVYLLATEALIFKTENVYAMVTRTVYVICDPAHLLKTAIGGTGENSISQYFLK